MAFVADRILAPNSLLRPVNRIIQPRQWDLAGPPVRVG